MVLLTERQKEGLSPHMLKRFKTHPTASDKHINTMLKSVKKGMRFDKAHDEAVKKLSPKNYIPKSLSKKDEKEQRPKLESFKSKKSNWVEKFENKYKVKITNKKYINTNIISSKGQSEIIDKGMGAYYSSGSRPNQTPFSWGNARLASVIMGGPARKIDKKIWEKNKK